MCQSPGGGTGRLLWPPRPLRPLCWLLQWKECHWSYCPPPPQVKLVGNGRLAVEAVQKAAEMLSNKNTTGPSYDLVLMDLQMPVLVRRVPGHCLHPHPPQAVPHSASASLLDAS